MGRYRVKGLVFRVYGWGVGASWGRYIGVIRGKTCLGSWDLMTTSIWAFLSSCNPLIGLIGTLVAKLHVVTNQG